VVNLNSALFINADKGQIEQVLLNLIKNAKEAQEKNHNPRAELSPDLRPELKNDIEIQVFKSPQQVIIKVLDQGGGIANTANLFVPFYTTKATGSGIGLALSRQIITNHKGELCLANRTDTQGGVATISLPMQLC